MKESIAVDNERVFITGTNFHYEIKWSEVTSMHAFKVDFCTWDRVDLEIVYGEWSITINEDIEGWDTFVQKVEELFPSIPKNWDTAIVQPPFETNFTTIYSRS